MKIRTQFIFSTAVFGVILLLIATSAVITNQRVEETNKQQEIARKLVQEANELSYLSVAYLLYGESLHLGRWQSKYDSASNSLSSLDPETPEQRVVLNNVKLSQERLKAVFAEVRAALEGTSQAQGPVLGREFVQLSWSRMEVQNQGMIFDASRLALMLHEQETQLRETNTSLIFAMLGVFGAFLLANYLLTHRRTLKSISELQAGTRAIGTGNLDFSIAVKRDDEIGELRRAFNLMTANLKSITASKAELEGQITERQKAEERANREKSIQEGINEILEAALICDTEEELGRTALAVAERLTASQFGFIDVLNSRGLLDSVAISNPGWEECRMGIPPDRHGKAVHDMAVHGIYGRVLRDGKALFTNDPSSHPDRIGTPEGHPPLTAFLGVPLTSGGKNIGMIGLGNRDGGYRSEDQEAVGALAAAIVQAFERKRTEEDIGRLNKSLSQRAVDLEVSNKELEAFSYSVSHDLRAPLRHIDGFSKTLLHTYQDSLDELGKHYLERLRAASQRMGQLIDDMLNLSRVTRAEMRREPVDLSLLARKVAAEVQQADPGRRAEFTIREGMIATGDPQLLQVVMENLLGNAWKFTSKLTTAKIEFGVTRQGDRPTYYVKDNGAGFDMAYAGKLFGAFQRLHGAEEFPGTGIGLATVHRIIRRHGGQVWAEGEVDMGATLYFTL